MEPDFARNARETIGKACLGPRKNRRRETPVRSGVIIRRSTVLSRGHLFQLPRTVDLRFPLFLRSATPRRSSLPVHCEERSHLRGQYRGRCLRYRHRGRHVPFRVDSFR